MRLVTIPALLLMFTVVQCSQSDPDIINTLTRLNEDFNNSVRNLTYNADAKTVYLNVLSNSSSEASNFEALAKELAKVTWTELSNAKEIDVIEVMIEQEDLGGTGLSNVTSAAMAQTFTFQADEFSTR